MTTNQLILLLDCHRGFEQDRHVDSLHNDMRILYKRGLLVSWETPSLTYEGEALVAKLLLAVI